MIKFQTFKIQTELTQAQKVIYSTTFLFSTLIIVSYFASLFWDIDIFDRHDTNSIMPFWLFFLLSQAYYQNKFWSQSFQLKLFYPTVKTDSSNLQTAQKQFYNFKQLYKNSIKPNFGNIFFGFSLLLIFTGVAIFGYNHFTFQQQEQQKKLQQANDLTEIRTTINNYDKGSVIPFYSHGIAKAKGLKFQIDYPYNYQISKVDRADVVTKISSPDSKFSVNILVKDFNRKLSQKVIDDALTYNSLYLTASAMNLETVSIDTDILVGGEKAASIDTYSEISSDGMTLRCYQRTYYTYYENLAIEIHFYLKDTTPKFDLNDLFQSHIPLINRMISSFKISN